MTDNRDASTWRALAPFAEHLQLRFLPSEAGAARAALPLRPELTNRKGDLHGGVIAALMDMTAGQALRGSDEAIKGVSTITMTTNYLEPATGEITAQGRVVKAGRSIGWVDVTAHNANGLLVATANCTFRIIR